MSLLGGIVVGCIATSVYFLDERAIYDAVIVQQKGELLTQESLKKTLAACEVEARILNNSKLALQALTEELQQQADEQARELEFYRRLMAAEKGKEGIDLNAWSVNQLAEHEYLIRLTFVQYAQQHQMISASVQVYLEGLQEGQRRKYTLKELLSAGASFNQALKFRYFQIIEGYITLPKDFLVEKVVVEIKRSGRNTKPITFDFSWQVQEI